MRSNQQVNYQLCLIFSIIISLSQQDELHLSKSESDQIHKNKRIMYEEQNCILKDTLFDGSTNGPCFKCVDKFLLPDCSTCPIGYKISINNQINTCEKCPDGQIFCDSQQSSVCFNGFTQDSQSKQCQCKFPSILRYEWCTDDQEFYYYSFYQDGQIKSKFSADIVLKEQISNDNYSFNKENCLVLENLDSNFLTIKDQIECRIDPDQKNVFAMSLKNLDVTNKSYEDVPIFRKDTLQMKLRDQNIQNPNLIYQNTNQNQIKKVYVNLNEQSNDECQFKSSGYRLIIGSNVIPKDQLILKNFSRTTVNFIIWEIERFVSPDISMDIIDGLNLYPNDMIIDVGSFPSMQGEDHHSYKFSFSCQLPFGLLSTSQLQITHQNFYFFKYSITMNDQYYTSDNVIAQINLDEGSFQQGDTFAVIIEQVNSLNQRFVAPEFTFQGGSYLYQIDKFILKPDSRYTLHFKIRYILEQESHVISKDFRVDESPFYCQINGGNQQNINPLNMIAITGQISSSKYQNLSDYQYSWSCFIQNSQDSCKDKFQNVIQFPSSTEIKIPEYSFDFSKSYIIQLQASLISDPNVFYKTSIQISTIPLSINIQFDQNYTNNGLNFDQLLQFNLIYSQYLDSSLRQIWVANKNFKHHFEIQFQDQPLIISESQIEPQFYFRLKDIAQLKIQDYMEFQIRFFVTSFFETIAVSEKFNFYAKPLPRDCSLQIGQLNGQEKAFNDLININIQNCQSFSGNLYYLFMYQKENGGLIQEEGNSNFYLNSYLTKFSQNNQISTYLPPGNIVISVIVKDIQETKVLLSSSIRIQKSEFNILEYETFLINQFQVASNYKNNNQFEEELCTIGIIIDCITDFESENMNEDPSEAIIQIKIQLDDRLETLPALISNDLLSQQLQEYILRCLDKLSKTKKSSNYDNIIGRFDQLQDIIQISFEQIGKMQPFLQEVKDTYKQQMMVAFNMTTQQIKEINKNQQDLALWNEKQIQGIQKILDCIALTLNINQPKTELTSDLLQAIVHRVDYQLLQKQYLKIDQNNDQQLYDDYQIYYDVKNQNWNKNIYSDEYSFKSQFDPYYQRASEEIKQELDRVYPAINSQISMWYDMPIHQRRILLLDKVENLILPQNSSLLYQFNNVESSSSNIVCTQKISEVWSTKLCKTELQNTNGKMQVICSCSKPSYTTLIYDFQSLLQNQNVGEIFSAKGILDIAHWTNWYEYAAIYTIFIVNLGFIISLIFLNKKDKKGLFEDRDVFEFMQSGGLQTLQQQRYSDNEIYKSENDSQRSKSNDIESLKNIKYPESAININQYQLNAKTMDDLKRSHQTTDNLKTESEIRINQLSDQKTEVSKQQNNYIDIVLNKQQINTVKEIEIICQIQQYDQPGFRQYFVESENKTLHLHQPQKQLNKADNKMTQEQLNRIKRKSQQYLQGIKKLKAVGTFHQVFQIFLVFNKKSSRIYRLCIFYSNIIWLLAISVTFGKNLTTSQVFILSFISSVTFGIYSFLFQLLQKKQILRYCSYFLCSCFLIFCYYAIIVSISNSPSEEANIWIFNYFLTLFINIFFFGVIIAIIKLFLTKKLLESLSPQSFIFSITGADTIFQMFE